MVPPAVGPRRQHRRSCRCGVSATARLRRDDGHAGDERPGRRTHRTCCGTAFESWTAATQLLANITGGAGRAPDGAASLRLRRQCLRRLSATPSSARRAGVRRATSMRRHRGARQRSPRGSRGSRSAPTSRAVLRVASRSSRLAPRLTASFPSILPPNLLLTLAVLISTLRVTRSKRGRGSCFPRPHHQ